MKSCELKLSVKNKDENNRKSTERKQEEHNYR